MKLYCMYKKNNILESRKMGRRRKNELKPGDNVTIYIPQDVERDVLHFMRTQANLSKTVFKILESYVLRKNRDYLDFDDFYGERDIAKHHIMKEESFRRSLDDQKQGNSSLNSDIKEFIREAIKSEVGKMKDTAEEEPIEEKSEIKSRHEDKLKTVQNIIESEEKQKEKTSKDMDDLFNEFSKTIEEDSSKKAKNVEIPKNYLWEYEDE
jgi:hypothetical protein